jgi:DNA-directed RNA polymerase specialized sigma24 family protein
VSEEISLAFFERHQRMVLGVAYRLLGRIEDAQDAAQEAFIGLFKNKAKWKAAPSGGFIG